MNKEIKNKIAFFGTPALCLPILESLKENDLTPCVIISQQDKPSGRGMKISPPTVKIWAEKNNIPVLQPQKLNDDFLNQLKEYYCDIFIVVAYGRIIPENIINLPSHGTINVHYSLLPKHRGASPVEGAILAGDSQTGVAIQKMVFALDEGPIIKEVKIDIDEKELKPSLFGRLNKIASDILPSVVESILNGSAKYKEQDSRHASYSFKWKKEDTEIYETDDEIYRWKKFRAFVGWPGVFTVKNNIRLKITDADFIDEKFIIKKVIPEAKKETNFDLWLKTNS